MNEINQYWCRQEQGENQKGWVESVVINMIQTRLLLAFSTLLKYYGVVVIVIVLWEKKK